MLRKLFLCFAVLFAFSAHANISLSPYYLELNDIDGRNGQIRFTNNSGATKTYDISLVNFKQEQDGKYTPVTAVLPGNPFADSYLEWAPHRATLAPGQSQVVRVRRRGMAAAPDGEYVSHMLIRELPDADSMYGTYNDNKNGLTINLRALYGVSIPVMIVRGRLWSDARIDNVKILNRNGHPTAVVTVSRSGTRSFFGTLVVKSGRRELGRLANFRIFMTTPSRTLEIPLTQMPDGDATVALIDENTDETLETKSF